MKAVAVISEYNPFHNGHKLHVSLAKAQSGCDYVIAVMSGNFVQRGEPAIVDKYLRTQMALSSGVDMVIELPVYYSTASAEYFAYNAVRLIEATGVVDTLAFGSESGNLPELIRSAETLAAEDSEYRHTLKAGLKRGESYPRARANAINNDPERIGVPITPNDILAVEYLKALNKTGTKIRPIAITRRAAGYHQLEISGEIASATAIRHAVLSGDIKAAAHTMPMHAYDILQSAIDNDQYVRGVDAYSEIFRYILRTNTQLDEILDISEGLHNRFIEMSGRFTELSQIISAVKTKRYTHTRLNRAALHILLNIRSVELERYCFPPYIRVLGMKKSAAPLMKALTSTAACPIVTYLTPAKKILNSEAWDMLEKEITATDIYYLGLSSGDPVPAKAEFKKEFVIVT